MYNSLYEVNSNGAYLVLLDALPSETLIREGQARDVINRIQQAKKSAKLVPTEVNVICSKKILKICLAEILTAVFIDQVQILIEDKSKQSIVQSVTQEYFNMIQTHVRSDLHFDTSAIQNDEIYSGKADLGKGKDFIIKIYRWF